MTQAKRDITYTGHFGARLSLLIARLEISSTEMAKKLGYKNSSTVLQACRGRTLLSAERLALLGQMRTAAGARPSLDWLLTGQGDPLVSSQGNDEISEMLLDLPPDAQEDIKAYLRVRAATRQRPRERSKPA